MAYSQAVAMMSLEERVMRHVVINPVSKCWEWHGRRNGKGYAEMFYEGKKRLVHRFYYEYSKGNIPDGLVLDHLCRHRSCVNPDHLEPVTQKENVRRGVNWQRQKTHCPKGHPFSAENTYIGGRGGVTRHCIACRRDQSQKRRKHDNTNAPRI